MLSLLDIVRNKRLTLLTPDHWYDRNDVLGVRAYSRLRGHGSLDDAVYAMCFAIGKEQAHHWQLFAGSDHGVCIRFDREELALHFDKLNDPVLHGPVQYRNLKQVEEARPIPLDLLPFLKRDTYSAEAEYRVVAWEEKFFATAKLSIPLPPSLVKQLIFGPTMPESYNKMLRDLAHEDPEWRDVQFSRSRLVNNDSWAEAVEKGTTLLDAAPDA